MATNYRPPDGYLTLGQAQEHLGVSKATLQKLVRAGKLTTYSDQRNRRVRLLKAKEVDLLLRPVPEKGGPVVLPAAELDPAFVRQVAEFIEHYRPALEALARQ